MPRVRAIIEKKGIFEYLDARGLVRQYQKAKRFLLLGGAERVRFKERQPQGSDIWSFRINKQFRALGTLYESGVLAVFHIDNHQ